MRPLRARSAGVLAALALGVALGFAPDAAAQAGSPAAPKAAAKDAAKDASKDAKPPSAAKPTKATKAAPAKAAPPKKATGGGKKAPRKAGSEPGQPDEATRRIIAGTPAPAGPTVEESAELATMRAIDRALFPEPGAGEPWPSAGPSLEPGGPTVTASGLPPSSPVAAAEPLQPASDLSWLRGLVMPDIPVRWDARVVRYLEYYKNDRKGRGEVAIWIKKSGRYGAAIRKSLREQGAPDDLLWLSLVESAFNPTVFSRAGAAGLWQFMPEGARIYGLTVDRWVDERLDPERSTVAAARYLLDLKQRFGSWELAFAAYNMGFGGLLAAIKKYNTNDYWELSRYEAGVPYETALYVPKIMAIAIVARNRDAFGIGDVELDPAVEFDRVSVGSGISVESVASASGSSLETILALNPQLIASRTPPLAPSVSEERAWVVRVPPGAGARAAKTLPDERRKEPTLGRYSVRWGEGLDDVAARFGLAPSALAQLNGLRKDEVLRPKTVLFVPGGIAPAEPTRSERAAVVVASDAPLLEGERRVFYRVAKGDSLRELASVLRVPAPELARWNALDPLATLQPGMTLEAHVPAAARLDDVVLLEEAEVSRLVAGSIPFLEHFEAQKGRKRVEITARDGDSWASIGRRYGVSAGNLERINQRSRSSSLRPGDKVIVYVPLGRAMPAEPKADDEPRVAKAVDDDGPKEPEAPSQGRRTAPSEADADAASEPEADAPVPAAGDPPQPEASAESAANTAVPDTGKTPTGPR
jgi:membrane-bound lytic murein transglycosylase D